jgi:hypothetical protein
MRNLAAFPDYKIQVVESFPGCDEKRNMGSAMRWYLERDADGEVFVWDAHFKGSTWTLTTLDGRVEHPGQPKGTEVTLRQGILGQELSEESFTFLNIELAKQEMVRRLREELDEDAYFERTPPEERWKPSEEQTTRWQTFLSDCRKAWTPRAPRSDAASRWSAHLNRPRFPRELAEWLELVSQHVPAPSPGMEGIFGEVFSWDIDPGDNFEALVARARQGQGRELLAGLLAGAVPLGRMAEGSIFALPNRLDPDQAEVLVYPSSQHPTRPALSSLVAPDPRDASYSPDPMASMLMKRCAWIVEALLGRVEQARAMYDDHFDRMTEQVHRNLADRRGDEFLYRLWRAYFRRPSELAEFIAMGRAHPSLLARSAAELAEKLADGSASLVPPCAS